MSKRENREELFDNETSEWETAPEKTYSREDKNQNELLQYMRELNRYPVIRDQKEVAELVERWRKNGDRQAYDRLVYGNTRLILSIAFKYLGHGGVSLLDLLQTGFIGLINALKKFDPKKAKLSTYASWWIKAEIGRLIPSTTTKRAFHLPPKTYQRISLLARSINGFFDQHNRWPNDQEVHDWIHTFDGANEKTQNVKNMTLREIKLCRRLLTERYYSLDAPLPTNGEEEGGRLLGDVTADPEMDVAKIAEARCQLSKVQAEIDKFEPRTRAILRLRLLEDKSLEEIGERFGVSRQAIQQIEKKAIEKIGRKLRISTAKDKQRRLRP